jgi:hypothetical protein
MTPRIAAVAETPDDGGVGAAAFAAVLSLMVGTPLRTYLEVSVAVRSVYAA